MFRRKFKPINEWHFAFSTDKQKESNTDIVIMLIKLSHCLDKIGIYNFLDLTFKDTLQLKQYIYAMCDDTDEARKLLHHNLLLLYLRELPRTSSYNKEKIKKLFIELSMQIDGRFKRNLEKINFDLNATVRQAAMDILNETAVNIFFQNCAPEDVHYWNTERKVTLMQLIDQAQEVKWLWSSAYNATANILIEKFNVTNKEIKEKNIGAIRDKILQKKHENLVSIQRVSPT